MTDLGWIIFGCTVLALAAIEVIRICRRKRRDDLKPTDYGA